MPDSFVPKLRFGSPFDHDPQHPQDVVSSPPPSSPDQVNGDESPGPLTRPCEVIIWDGVTERDISAIDDKQRRQSHQQACATPSSGSTGCQHKLGKVKFFVRGEGDSKYSTRTARLTDDCMLIPVPELASSPSCVRRDVSTEDATNSDSYDADMEEPMTLQQWLFYVRRDSSRKAPLPRNWYSLPIESLRQLAEERGFMSDGSESRISLVKFLRNWENEHHVPG